VLASVTLPCEISLVIAEPLRRTARAAFLLMLAAACSSEPDGSSPNAGGTSNASGAAAGAAAGAAGTATNPAAGGSSGFGGTSQAGAPAGGAGTAGSSGGSGQAGAGAGGSAGNGSGGSGGSGIPVLEPCADPAVSRLKKWEMQVVGGTQVPTGSPLRQVEGGGYEMYVEWTLNGGGEQYGTANAPLNNMGQYSDGADPAKNGVDISQGPAIIIAYSSTGSTYLQIRTGAVPHGGDHFKADLPSTDGQLKIISLALDSFRRPGGTTPPGDDVLKDAFSFTFVGSATTKLALRHVYIPGFVPPCD
jgi:hypothetical protein